jgi:hypothetical protein
VGALEGAAERLLGVIAHPAGHRADRMVGGGEQILGQMHAPVGEVTDRRAAQHLTEPVVQD